MLTTDALVAQILDSKLYACICDETVRRIATELNGRYRTDGDTIKAVKNKLHRISTSFIHPKSAAYIMRMMEGWTHQPDTIRDDCADILSMHLSSTERADSFTALYRDICSITRLSRGHAVLDVGCGVNPFALPLVDYSGGRYHATDINLPLIQAIDKMFAITGIDGYAEASDILVRIPNGRYHTVFLFKLLPLLEQQRRGYGAQLLRTLDATYYCVTFPTATMGGKSVGMRHTYTTYMHALAAEVGLNILHEGIYGNELLFIAG